MYTYICNHREYIKDFTYIMLELSTKTDYKHDKLQTLLDLWVLLKLKVALSLYENPRSIGSTENSERRNNQRTSDQAKEPGKRE